jgi:hypothetical protein
MIPFCGVIIWFAVEWIHTSYVLGEISASQVGLTHRWIIKSVLLSGLCVALVSGVSVWLQMVVVLWGPQGMRFPLMTMEWPEDEAKVEGLFVSLGIVASMSFYIIFNIGMTVGIFPVTGLPLPLLSYGGSSLITNFFALGLLMNIEMRRTAH